MKKILEKSIAGLLALVLMMSCAWMLPKDVYAADGNAVEKVSGVVYQPYTKSKALEHFKKQDNIPTYYDEDQAFGYVFGGWYEKNTEGKFEPIKNDDELNKASNCYAKFVPAYVLSVRCQNKLGTVAESSSTKMRYIAGLDSTNYAEVGFIVYGVSFDGTYVDAEKGYTNTEKNLVKARHAGTNDGVTAKKITTVYENVYVYKTNNVGETEGVKRPAKVVFGEGANYMMTYLLSVNQKNFGRTYAIQPYWVTFDGVKVKGLAKYAHVEDGINKYVNVPINLTSTDEVAAGKITVDFTELANNGYTFMEAECGTVFPEKVVKKVGNTIQCVATVVNDHAESPVENKASDNIYINLRFKRTENKGNGYDNRYFVKLPVSDVQFAKITDDPNTPEALVPNYKVWDVRF